ncbi:hypothetical protein HK405_011945 [Cladochytrium tenue]|nr:hypothetical protein HK405_011945 [Cladochytrium tenue]
MASRATISAARSSRAAAPWAMFWLNLLSGDISVGSRTPVAGTPAWVTPRVLHGGFANGTFLAGGPLLPFEAGLLEEHLTNISEPPSLSRRALQLQATDRLRLNMFFLSARGRSLLSSHLDDGTYRVSVPEEAVILTLVLLERKNDIARAEDILKAILPWIDRLRFYPELCATPQPLSDTEVFRMSVKEVTGELEQRSRAIPNWRASQHYFDVTVKMPLFDELVSLFAETIASGEPMPFFETRNGKKSVSGGWPCRVYPMGWRARMRSCVERIAQITGSKREINRHSFKTLVELGKKAAAGPALLSGKEVGRIRFYLAGINEKRGLPGSDRCVTMRERHRNVPDGTEGAVVARALLNRLEAEPEQDGLANPDSFIAPLTQEEASSRFIVGKRPMPSLTRLICMATKGSPEVLMDRGLIPSGEVLASLLPRITATRTSSDPALNRLYLATYASFRNRRSLLLLNYQHQIRFNELPWAAALEAHTDPGTSAAAVLLRRVSRIFLKAFPDQITPNKLVTELQTLFANAGRSDKLLEELASDIFMGRFTPKFSVAARRAIEDLHNSVYGRYYRLPSLERLPSPPQEFLSALVNERVDRTGTYVVRSGKQIEQAQILTTHNLVYLASVAELSADDLKSMILKALASIDKMAGQASSKRIRWGLRLASCKNAAYAWRQVIFYFAMLEKAGDVETIRELLAAGKGEATRKLLGDLSLCFGDTLEDNPDPTPIAISMSDKAATVHTLAEIAKHTTGKDCWMVIDGLVYDVTDFLSEHPGGDEVMLDVAGKDATQAFEDIGHSDDARKTLKSYLIGKLDPTSVPPPAAKKSGGFFGWFK